MNDYTKARMLSLLLGVIVLGQLHVSFIMTLVIAALYASLHFMAFPPDKDKA